MSLHFQHFIIFVLCKRQRDNWVMNEQFLIGFLFAISFVKPSEPTEIQYETIRADRTEQYLFYHKSDLTVYSEGRTFRHFNVIPGSRSGQLGKAALWTEKVPYYGSSDTIVMPVTLHHTFKYKSALRKIIKYINNEITGLKIVEVLYSDHLNFNPFTNGILFISAHMECFWTIGKSPGFSGSLMKTVSDFGAKPKWQLVSITDACDVRTDQLLSILMYSLGVGPYHGDKNHSVMNSFEGRLTSNDILAIYQLYNLKSRQKLLQCPVVDNGADRIVFTDRLCDGHTDCINSEDETTPCTIDLTENGCCKTLVIPTNQITCKSSGHFLERDIYQCDNEYNYIYRDGEYFVVGFLGDPRISNQLAWSYKLPAINNCPDTSQPWVGPTSRISVICESVLDSGDDKRYTTSTVSRFP